jgi:type I phosphodiesterase/nucleotide pyrophosphatase
VIDRHWEARAVTAPLLPEYGRRSLAEVFPALLAALGVPGPPPALAVPPARAAALLLVDGLGSELLRRHSEDAPFLASLPDIGPLTAGFPSSTSISLASLGTGVPPGTHGLLGIVLRTGGELLDTLGWTTEGGRVDMRERLVPEEVQPVPTALQRAAADGVAVTVVSLREFEGSGLTRAALRGGRFQGTYAAGDLAAGVLAATAGPGRQLCYGYHRDLDALGHLYGPGSLPWRLELAQIDRLAQVIADRLPRDAVLTITGDHGMVAVDRRYDADTDPVLSDGVAQLSGDPRARYVHVRPGARDDVLATWREVLGDGAWIVPGEQAVADGWFGLPVAPHARDRIGDVVVAASGGTAVIRSRAERFISRMPGQHGSLTPDEQLVPLLLTTRG